MRKFSEVRYMLRELRKRRLKAPGFQLNGWKFQGSNSSMRCCGWPSAMASSVDFRCRFRIFRWRPAVGIEHHQRCELHFILRPRQNQIPVLGHTPPGRKLVRPKVIPARHVVDRRTKHQRLRHNPGLHTFPKDSPFGPILTSGLWVDALRFYVLIARKFDRQS